MRERVGIGVFFCVPASKIDDIGFSSMLDGKNLPGDSYAMFNIKLEGFPTGSTFHDAIRRACLEVKRRSELAQQISRPKTRRALEEWFGDADIPEVWANLARLDKVIRDSNRTVTFVNAVGKVIRVEYNPDNIAQPPVFSTKPPTLKEMRGVYAWVYPTLPQTTGTGNGDHSGPLFHTGSGMRLYLGYQIVTKAPIKDDELVQTIYHELSHKVIGTNDHEYGRNESKSLIGDGRALKNADNYGYFLLSVD
jgi:hypothetical protein